MTDASSVLWQLKYVGRAIDPKSCAGQIEGAVHMDLGTRYQKTLRLQFGNGVPDSLLLRDCGILKAKDTPKVDVILIQVPDEIGGYGSKGVGEIGLVPTAAAVAGALYAYDGIRRFRLPMQDSPAAAPSVPKNRNKQPAGNPVFGPSPTALSGVNEQSGAD